jgi:hypothetical protein
LLDLKADVREVMNPIKRFKGIQSRMRRYTVALSTTKSIGIERGAVREQVG